MFTKIVFSFFELCSFVLLLTKIFTDADISWFEVFIPIMIPMIVCLFVVMVLLCQIAILNDINLKELLKTFSDEKIIDKKQE